MLIYLLQVLPVKPVLEKSVSSENSSPVVQTMRTGLCRIYGEA